MEGESSEVRGELSPSFPQEIIEEILKRLPVKPLLRFKCVSKSWFSIISSPTFIKLHLRTAVNNNSKHNCLVCVYADPRNHFISFSLRHLMDEDEDDPITSVSDLTNPDLPLRIVGSCHGMVCVALEEEKLYLWNPSIRKQILLPPLNVRSGYGCYMKDGFGYDELNNDYKVVAIFYCVYHAGPFKVKIFSLRTNTWKRIEDFKYGNPLDNSGKYVKGKLHWLVDINGSPDIVSLDLSTEEYARVSPPHNASNSSCTMMEYDDPCLTLGLFSGNLCMLFDDHRSRMDLWVMKDYGVADSWTRVFKLAYLGTPGFYPHMLRIVVLNEDEILLLYGCIVVVYCLKNHSYRYPPIDCVASVRHGDVFVESLVLPYAYGVNRLR